MEFLRTISFWVLTAVSGVGYYLFAYVFSRSEHMSLFAGFVALFAFSVVLILLSVRLKYKWYWVFAVGLIFRLVFLMATPHLSNDYFRFTWDGELQKRGISAFEFVPDKYDKVFEKDSLLLEHFSGLYRASSEHFEGMNSKHYYSIYPAVNQFAFAVSSVIGSPNSGNLVVLRLWMLLAEVITFFVLRALLLKRGKPEYLSGWYWLNPLVIIELTGNLHFDGVAITFILLALWYVSLKKSTVAGVMTALAIHTKLNPLFMLGALFRNISLRQLLITGATAIVVTVLLFTTIMTPETFLNFKQSFGLYFAWFGFNAGPFRLLRELGEGVSGTNLTSWIALVFPFISMALMGFVTLFSKTEVAHKLLILYVIYFSFSPIVHPWYITMLVPLGILSQKIYPLLWSFLIFFTYAAYGENFNESSMVIYIEYGLVYLMMYTEYRNFGWTETLKKKIYPSGTKTTVQ